MKIKNIHSISRDEIAFIFQVSPPTISRWKKTGFPINEGGTYNLRACIEFALERASATKKVAASTEEHETESARWLAEYRKERAAITKLERERLEGSLITKTDMEEGFTARAYEFARSLMSLSRRISHRVAGRSKKRIAQVENIILDEVVVYLNNYARPLDLSDTVTVKCIPPPAPDN